MITRRDLRRPLPEGWGIVAACDTGTYLSATITLFPPDCADAFIVEECPNYRYVGGELELLDFTIPKWGMWVGETLRSYLPTRSRFTLWCDENSQFKTAFQPYGLNLKGNPRKLELRTEISREYFSQRHVFLAPWLSVLPYELEYATWPDDVSSAGRFERLKVKDHTLDCLEHTLSRRPRNKAILPEEKVPFLQQQFEQLRRRDQMARGDPHLGSV